MIVLKYCICCRSGPLGTTLVRAVSALNNFMVSALGTHMVSALGNHRGLPLLKKVFSSASNVIDYSKGTSLRKTLTKKSPG